jgi:hypothetical protein
VNTVAHRKNGRWLATAVESHLNAAHGRATVTVQIYRWSSRRWVSQARVPIVVRVPHGDGRLFAISAAFLTRSAVPDFELGGMATIPSWAAVVSHVGGTWHVVPFRAGGRTSTTAEVPQSEFPDRGRVVVQRAHGTVDYRLRDGIFQPTHSVTPDPPCRKSSLPPRRRSAATRLACAYGYALGTGVNRRGKSVAVVFAVLNGRWTFDLSARTPARALRQDGTVPLWLASLLERELRP